MKIKRERESYSYSLICKYIYVCVDINCFSWLEYEYSLQHNYHSNTQQKQWNSCVPLPSNEFISLAFSSIRIPRSPHKAKTHSCWVYQTLSLLHLHLQTYPAVLFSMQPSQLCYKSSRSSVNYPSQCKTNANSLNLVQSLRAYMVESTYRLFVVLLCYCSWLRSYSSGR